MRFSCDTMSICSGKPLKRRTSKDQSSKNAVGLESSFPAGETDMLEKDDGM